MSRRKIKVCRRDYDRIRTHRCLLPSTLEEVSPQTRTAEPIQNAHDTNLRSASPTGEGQAGLVQSRSWASLQCSTNTVIARSLLPSLLATSILLSCCHHSASTSAGMQAYEREKTSPRVERHFNLR